MNTPLISRALQRCTWLVRCAWPTGCASKQTRDHGAFRAEAALRISVATQRLLSAGGPNGLLYGPCLPMYGRK